MFKLISSSRSFNKASFASTSAFDCLNDWSLFETPLNFDSFEILPCDCLDYYDYLLQPSYHQSTQIGPVAPNAHSSFKLSGDIIRVLSHRVLEMAKKQGVIQIAWVLSP